MAKRATYDKEKESDRVNAGFKEVAPGKLLVAQFGSYNAGPVKAILSFRFESKSGKPFDKGASRFSKAEAKQAVAFLQKCLDNWDKAEAKISKVTKVSKQSEESVKPDRSDLQPTL